MQKDNFKISPYSSVFRPQILNIWERSVLATHDFLDKADFEEIKAFVADINFNDFELYCLINGNLIIGFIGVAEKRIEMLFLDPKYIGKGFGQKLLNFAVRQLNADQVDVNEQNIKALRFYQRYGFEIYERTEKDDQGKNYPLLRMRLRQRKNS